MQNVDKQFLDSLTELLGKVKDAPIDQRLKCLEELCYELNIHIRGTCDRLYITDTINSEQYYVLNDEEECEDAFPPFLSNFHVVNIDDL